ncbi:hypothetical protein [Kutzneria kofuensis]|uniref:hypothetical protein n=1 Tax=Kutzneria kofuensis TaxID=103725 RepID=UPI0031F1AB3A
MIAPVRFYADLHIHSKYSRACSRDCDLEHLTWWAQRKGISLVGTGDFTHPAWYDHLRETLVPAEPACSSCVPSSTATSPARCRPAASATSASCSASRSPRSTSGTTAPARCTT